MTVLAIESSALVAGIAIVSEEKVTAEYNVNLKLTHSQTLLPMLDEVVKMTGTDLSSIDAIAVSGGPGSFTGLRIGSATAKGLGLALKKPIVAVPTTQGLAMNIFGFDGLICPIMDARRDQVYTGIYRNNAEGFSVVSDQEATGIKEIVEKLDSLGEKVIFLGDGVPVFRSVIEECAKEMAEGVVKATGSDFGVSATGYAGPDGDNVGLVYYAVNYKGKTVIKKLHSGYERNLIRESATMRALFLVH
ncbi:MAG: tRNA (adenosine(37)-N6)-threonylcarbamoyltransferase complex dimerization subunit type 1 TsaB, partial [Lachnospiraceae bacterium]|nr:tRNA (adenosine(37)-N6)-threonylcarbamoyltransferase complex dimerization subunit type 1 TsaB [Lachnospiraceae bacterium]